MKLIKYRDNERRLVCSACYSHYMERLALQQTGSEQARVRRKWACAAGFMQGSNASPAVNPLFLPTESVNVDPTLENPAAVHGEDHRKRVHEEVSRGYRGSKSLDMREMQLTHLITFRGSRVRYGYAIAV